MLLEITSQLLLIIDGLFPLSFGLFCVRHESIIGYTNIFVSVQLACTVLRIKMRRHDSNRRHYRSGAGCKHVVMYSYWPTVLYGPQSEGSSSAVIFEF